MRSDIEVHLNKGKFNWAIIDEDENVIRKDFYFKNAALNFIPKIRLNKNDKLKVISVKDLEKKNEQQRT